MKMNTLYAAVSGAFLLGAATLSYGATMPKSEYSSEKDRIHDNYKVAAESCEPMSGNAKDICKAQAKADESIAKAELEARYKGTRQASLDARITKAKAEYSVAKEKCDDFKGNEKDVCRQTARSDETKAIAEAKANKEIIQARADERDATRDADYKVAREKCDALTDDAKTRCVDEAKQKYGKS